MVAEGSQVPEPDAPRRSGYSFLGWYIAGTSTKYDFTTPVTSDLVLEARWSRNTTYYTVRFNANEPQDAAEEVKDLPEAISIASGRTIGDITSPTLDGYTFTGWYTDAAAQTSFDTTSDPVTKNLELYAGWSKASFTITFSLNLPDDLDPSITVQAPPDQTVTAGTALQAVASPSLPGTTIYAFGGWWHEDESEGESKIEDLAQFIPAEDMTIYAKWDVENSPWDGSSAITMHIIQQADDADGIIEIRTAAELAGLAKIVNGDEVPDLPEGFDRTFDGKTIRIMNDIELNEKPWVPIGHSSSNAFKGSVEGASSERTRITGLTVKSDNSSRYYTSGLFGRLYNAEKISIKNLAVKCTITSENVSHGSGAFGYISAAEIIVENCELMDGSTISLSGGNSAGGIVGAAYLTKDTSIVGSGPTNASITFSNCITGDVTISRMATSTAGGIGGIVGFAQAMNESNTIYFTACTSEASLTSGNDQIIGFLAGGTDKRSSTLITDCHDDKASGLAPIGNRPEITIQ